MNDMNSPDISPFEAGAGPADPTALMNAMLMAQARSLDAMFTEMAGQSAKSMPYLDSTAAYARLALKAQANCRAALEAMARADRLQHREARFDDQLAMRRTLREDRA